MCRKDVRWLQSYTQEQESSCQATKGNLNWIHSDRFVKGEGPHSTHIKKVPREKGGRSEIPLDTEAELRYTNGTAVNRIKCVTLNSMKRYR